MESDQTQLRFEEHPVLTGSAERQELAFTFNGRQLTGFEGDTIASALWANGYRSFRTDPDGSPGSMYCGTGHCCECRVTVNDTPNVRSCITPLEEGMEIVSERFIRGVCHEEESGRT